MVIFTGNVTLNRTLSNQPLHTIKVPQQTGGPDVPIYRPLLMSLLITLSHPCHSMLCCHARGSNTRHYLLLQVLDKVMYVEVSCSTQPRHLTHHYTSPPHINTLTTHTRPPYATYQITNHPSSAFLTPQNTEHCVKYSRKWPAAAGSAGQTPW